MGDRGGLAPTIVERFGGLDGIRDEGVLQSALMAGENAYFYGGGDLHDIGAAYAFHLAECQGFLDGNKAQPSPARRPS